MVENNNLFEEAGHGDGHIISFLKIHWKVHQWILDWLPRNESALKSSENTLVSIFHDFQFSSFWAILMDIRNVPNISYINSPNPDTGPLLNQKFSWWIIIKASTNQLLSSIVPTLSPNRGTGMN